MSRYRVLVVDDDVSIRMLLTAALEQEQLDVQTAPDGSSALALGLTCAFDLFLLDYLLPDMRGLDLALALRRHHPDAPIALITGTPHLVGEAGLAAAGITRLFAKPFHLNELVAWIHTKLPSTC